MTRRPSWLRKPVLTKAEAFDFRRAVDTVPTVCESARCPNRGECFTRGTATFLLLGPRCTRNCAFCSVEGGAPLPPDPEEAARIGNFLAQNLMEYVVLTSVTRDDLADGGSSHFRSVVSFLATRFPSVRLELLIPDFQGRRPSIEEVAALPAVVIGHNMETVRPLFPSVRPGGDYERSLEVLRSLKSLSSGRYAVKTGIMTGLGENEDDLLRLFADIQKAGADILTIGQYLRPSRMNPEPSGYATPDVFERWRGLALEAGLLVVESGPYIRSSYRANEGQRAWTGKRFDK